MSRRIRIELSNECQIALLAARSALSRGETPGPNTVGMLVLELERLSGEEPVDAHAREPAADPFGGAFGAHRFTGAD